MDNCPVALQTGPRNEPSCERVDDVHLRSVTDVRRYDARGTDGAIGRVTDFITEDETWDIRYMVIDTGEWWAGKSVLVAPKWARHISWRDKVVHVNLSRAAIRDSPGWNATDAVNRAYEERLYDYYGRPAYWANSNRLEAAQLQAPPRSQSPEPPPIRPAP
jgi:hypothetical protein